MGRRVLSKQKAEAILRGERRGEILDALRQLPEDVDVRLAADAVLPLVTGDASSKSCWLLGRHCQRLPAAVVRDLLGRLTGHARTAGNPHRDVAIFLTAMVSPELPDDRLVEAWGAALVGLLDLNTTYGWGSRQRREKIRGVAASREMVAALQAVAVGCERVDLDMLAVLCAEGSDASFDALMPHFVRAEQAGDGLTWLRRLRTHANPESKAIQSLLDSAAARLEAISGASPAVDLAQRVGFGRPELFWFDAWLGSTQLNENNVPRYQGSVRVDSRSPRWFRVFLTRVEGIELTRTTFDHQGIERDDLGVGRCAAQELPAWLRLTGGRLGVTWSLGLRSSVRGKKRQALEAWLLGGATGDG